MYTIVVYWNCFFQEPLVVRSDVRHSKGENRYYVLGQTGTGSGSAWIDEHHVGHLAGCPILLVMDVSEHAFTCDYGTKKADSIEASFAAAKPPDTKKG